MTSSDTSRNSQPVLRDFCLSVAFLLAITGRPIDSAAGELKAAVAANFSGVANNLGVAFNSATGHRVRFSFGSTGQLYAQIVQGAPFDVFLSADQARAQAAVDEGWAISGSQFTYATGRIVLYSRIPGLRLDAESLRTAPLQQIAIANPITAPYGAAAVQVMRALGVLERFEDKLVRGVNITQTYQFVATGNAEIGFVALSQVSRESSGSRWIVPHKFHRAIAQDAVLLVGGSSNAAARAFLAFLRGSEAQELVEQHGYGTKG
tara:strand:+ start:3194 stop:3982 length:789 start_codon:yes stop_codon:yes gene_type:complete